MSVLLEEHVRLTAESGFSRAQVRSLMLNAGWPEDLVNSYLDKAFKAIGKDIILRVNGLSKSFGPVRVLDQVDFDVRAGEIFGLIGVSGVGKSTLLNLIVGFLQPDSGDVLYAHQKSTHSVFRNPEIAKTLVGFSTQTPSFYKRLTVRENLEHFAALYRMHGQAAASRSNALMDLVGLRESKDVIAANLSGGMQKRLDIACALIHDPDILILDEPTADLDPIMRQQLWDLINKINKKGTTIILASHFLAEIELLCSRIAILQSRHIVDVGTADELRSVYARNYEISFQSSRHEYDRVIRALKKKKKYFSKVYAAGTELVVETPSPEQLLPVFTRILESGEESLQYLHVAKPSLGRVFEAVVKK